MWIQAAEATAGVRRGPQAAAGPQAAQGRGHKLNLKDGNTQGRAPPAQAPQEQEKHRTQVGTASQTCPPVSHLLRAAEFKVLDLGHQLHVHLS